MGRAMWIPLAAAVFAAAGCSPPDQEDAMKPKPKRPEIECVDCESVPPLSVDTLPASEEEWRKRLTPEQFYILRQRGTERAYTGEYLHHKEDGIYHCAGCGQALYDSKTKYDSCGWPSFWDAIPGTVETRFDGAVEAICSRCKGHLGHIFDDGPDPTGKRH